QGSFVPPTPIQEMRDLTRTRKQLAREIVQHQNRIEKVLEDANIKIATAISDTAAIASAAIGDVSRLAGSSSTESPRRDPPAIRGRGYKNHRNLPRRRRVREPKATSAPQPTLRSRVWLACASRSSSCLSLASRKLRHVLPTPQPAFVRRSSRRVPNASDRGRASRSSSN